MRTPSHNSRYIETTFNGISTTFTPSQILEYRTRYEKTYESRRIMINGEEKEVFLERLALGPIKLFYYRKKGLTMYFLEKGSKDDLQLIELKKSSYREELANQLTEQDWINDHIRIAKHRRNSLAKLIDIHNEGERRSFSYSKFGVLAGLGLTKMSVSRKFGFALRDSPISLATEIVRTTPIPSDLSLTFGIFGDIPILLSNLSLNFGLNYIQNSYSVLLESLNIRQEIEISQATFRLPIQFRHTFPTFHTRPFVNAGAVFSKNRTNESAVYQTVLSVSGAERQNIIRAPYVDDNQFGLTVGGGLQRTVDYRKTISLELRLAKFFGNSRSLGKTQANLLFGFTI